MKISCTRCTIGDGVNCLLGQYQCGNGVVSLPEMTVRYEYCRKVECRVMPPTCKHHEGWCAKPRSYQGSRVLTCSREVKRPEMTGSFGRLTRNSRVRDSNGPSTCKIRAIMAFLQLTLSFTRYYESEALDLYCLNGLISRKQTSIRACFTYLTDAFEVEIHIAAYSSLVLSWQRAVNIPHPYKD